jgi:hypothetical protein
MTGTRLPVIVNDMSEGDSDADHVPEDRFEPARWTCLTAPFPGWGQQASTA